MKNFPYYNLSGYPLHNEIVAAYMYNVPSKYTLHYPSVEYEFLALGYLYIPNFEIKEEYINVSLNKPQIVYSYTGQKRFIPTFHMLYIRSHAKKWETLRKLNCTAPDLFIRDYRIRREKYQQIHTENRDSLIFVSEDA